MSLLTLIPLLGCILFWKRVTRSRSPSAAIHASSAILVTLYLGSITNALQPVTVLLLVCGSLLFIYESIYLIKHKKPVPVSIGVFVILCCLFVLLHHDSKFHAFDEFSHWGVFLKEILAGNALWGSDSNAMVLRYPPGAPLWQYLFLRFTGWSEGSAYLAQFCLLILPLLVLWQNVKWRQYYWLIAIFVLLAITLSNFGHGFASLYVDHLLGAWFAGTIFSFMRDVEDRTPRQLLSYLLPVATIVLIKDAGLYFGLAATGIMALLVFWKVAFRSGEKNIGHGLIRAGTLTIVCLVCAGLISTSWDANRNFAGIPSSSYSTSGIVSGITNNESLFSTAEQDELRSRFRHVILHQQISKDETFERFGEFTYDIMPTFTDKYRLTTSSLILLFIIWQIAIMRKLVGKDELWRWWISSTGFLLTTLAYIGILFLSYRFAFDERGMLLPSYIRYSHTAILPMVLFSFLPLLPGFSQKVEKTVRLPGGRSASRPAIIFAVALLIFAAFEPPFVTPLYESHAAPGMRQQLKPFIDKIRGNVDGDARVWIYLPLTDARELRRRVFLYEMAPVRADVVTDPEFLSRDSDGILSVIENWDYMWFPVQSAESDEILKELFGDNLKDRVFRIHRGDGNIEIVALDGVFE